MLELYFYDPKVLENSSTGITLLANASQLHTAKGKPFFLNENGTLNYELNKFFDYICGPRRQSPNTWKSYAWQIHLFIRFMFAQGKDWKETQKDDLNKYFLFRTTQVIPGKHHKISNSTFNSAAAALVHLFEYAFEKGFIQKMPFNYKDSTNIYHKKKTKVADIYAKTIPPKINFIDISTYKTQWRDLLLKGQNSMRNLALGDLLISTGMRISEALSLKVRELPDPYDKSYADRRTIPLEIIGKGNKKRTIRIPKNILRSIKNYIEEERTQIIESYCPQNQSSDYVFLSRTGQKLNSRTVQNLFKATSNAVGIRLTPHGCRHTFAGYQLSALIELSSSRLIGIRAEGGNTYREIFTDPMRELQKLLGHATIATVGIYLDFHEEAETLVDKSLAQWTEFGSTHGNE